MSLCKEEIEEMTFTKAFTVTYLFFYFIFFLLNVTPIQLHI